MGARVGWLMLGVTGALPCCDPVLVEVGRAFPPQAGPAVVAPRPTSTTLQRSPGPCAGREDGAPCRGSSAGDGVALAVCRHQECVESRCGDGVVDLRLGEFCDTGAREAASARCFKCSLACEADHDCADASACNGVERCLDGRCARGSAVNCDDHDATTPDICVDSDGTCVHALPW